MITKEQYQQIKTMILSDNTDDVRLAGTLIYGLRQRKEIKKKMVNTFFRMLFDRATKKQTVWMDGPKYFVSVGNDMFYFTDSIAFKWKWLNGLI